jgi:hypothetical protein
VEEDNAVAVNLRGRSLILMMDLADEGIHAVLDRAIEPKRDLAAAFRTALRRRIRFGRAET